MTEGPAGSPRTPVSRSRATPKSERTPKHSVYMESPRDERHFVHRAKDRLSSQRTFRDSIRSIYHQTDFSASFAQTSALVAPLEATPKRPLMGKTKYKRDILESPRLRSPGLRTPVKKSRELEEEPEVLEQEEIDRRDEVTAESPAQRRVDEKRSRESLERERQEEEEMKKRERELREEIEREKREEEERKKREIEMKAKAERKKQEEQEEQKRKRRERELQEETERKKREEQEMKKRELELQQEMERKKQQEEERKRLELEVKAELEKNKQEMKSDRKNTEEEELKQREEVERKKRKEEREKQERELQQEIERKRQEEEERKKQEIEQKKQEEEEREKQERELQQEMERKQREIEEQKKQEEEARKKRELEEENERKKLEEEMERKREEELERKKQEEEQKKEEERKKRELEEESERKKLEEELEMKKQEEEKKRQEELERAEQEELERKRKEEEERKRQEEEEERRRQEEEEERRRQEEEEERKRQEEERAKQEALERERREKEERKRQEEIEKAKNEELEREKLEEERKKQEELEKRKQEEEERKKLEEERKVQEELEKQQKAETEQDNDEPETSSKAASSPIQVKPQAPQLSMPYDDQEDDEPGTPRKPFPPKKKMYISPTFSKYHPDDPSLERHGSQLLEISTRPYLYALSEKYKTKIVKLKDIPLEEFDELKSLGFEWVWFMGVWQLGQNCLNHDRCDHYLRDRYSNVCPGWSVEDVIGYPLCIVSYTLNTELGTEEDLVWLREQLNTRGMKLMLDFVPNHTAIDCPEMSEHPEWYLHANFVDPKRFMENGIAYGAGKWIPPMYFSAQLDMTCEEARRFQIENLKSIARRCDGVRAHVAHFCLTDLFMEQWSGVVDPSRRPEREFWEEAISEVASESPKFMIMAETYGIEIQKKLLELGFGYIYDKELLDDLTDSNLDHFRAVVSSQDVSNMEHFVHFVENHDESRSIERFYHNPKMSCAAAAALLSLPGLRLINFHQWLGYTYKIDVHLRRSLPERWHRDTLAFYTRFLRVLQTDAVRYGQWQLVDVYDASTVLAWKWVKDEQHILVTVNFSGCGSGGRIICPDVPLPSGIIPVKELIANVVYERDAQEMATNGLSLLLSPYQVQVFEY